MTTTERIIALQNALDAECEQKYKHVAEILDLKRQIAAFGPVVSSGEIREATIEECAKIVENTQIYRGQTGYGSMLLRLAAAASEIRALKSSPSSSWEMREGFAQEIIDALSEIAPKTWEDLLEHIDLASIGFARNWRERITKIRVAKVKYDASLALKSSPSVAVPPVGEWRPIETAPKDGSNVLVFDIDVGWVVAYWLNDGWLLVGGKFGAYPKCWLPLPAPPAGEERR